MAKKKPGPKPSEKEPMGYRATLKCHGDYMKWLTELAALDRLTIPALLDRALADFAKAKGFKLPPPR